MKHGNIEVFQDGNRIVVTDKSSQYSIDSKAISINEFGYETPITWKEAFENGQLRVWNDDIDGHSFGQHGSLYIKEY